MSEDTFIPTQNEPIKKEESKQQSSSSQAEVASTNGPAKMLEMPGKVKMAKISLQISGWISIALGLLAYTLIYAMSLLEYKSQIGTIMFGIILGILSLIAAQGISQKKSKTFGIVLGVLLLFSIPIGTLFGILILIGLLSEEANPWFQK